MSLPSKSPWRSRALVIGIALMAALPFVLAWYYVQHPELIGKRSNYGTLIVPPRPVETAVLMAKPLSPSDALSELKGRWVLLHVAAGDCGATCAETLHKTRQVRLMLNKEIPRVRRLLLVPESASPARYEGQIESEDGLLVAGASAGLLQTLASAVGAPPTDDMVLLLDPFSNLILWYDAGFDPYGLLKDLKHLLRASQIG